MKDVHTFIVTPGGRALVGVFAHPDDESLLAGGTLARASAAGARTAVIACTSGESGENWDPTVDPARIGAVRQAELRAACAVLGVTHVELLPYRDSGLPARGEPGSLVATPVEEVAGRLAERLERLAPAIVVTHDPTGGYGHPDHVRVAEATAMAARRLARPPRVYHCVLPRRTVDAFADAFGEAGLRAGRAAAAGADLDRDIGVDDAVVTTSLDVSEVVRQKRDAVAAHRSQMTGHVLFRLPWPVLARLWSEEHFQEAPMDAGRS